MTKTAKTVEAAAPEAVKAAETVKETVEAPKAAKKPAAKKTTAAKKAAAPKAEKKPAAKKTTAAKTTTTKKAAPKAAAVKVFVEYQGRQVSADDILEAVKAAAGKAKTLEVYVKPEDGAAYYVADGKDGKVSF